jgi:ubiquinone/menaquinone biosynthesis C-methylase UbiE
MAKTVVEKHFDEVAIKYDFYTKKRELHYSTLKLLLKSFIPVGKRVFEIGCGTGDLLASLNPKRGYGFDISSRMIRLAKVKHGSSENLEFSTQWPNIFTPKGGRYDYIFMSDVIEHLEDPSGTFKKIPELMNSKTLFINTMMNPVWEPVEQVYSWMGLKMPEGPHRRIKYKELRNVYKKAGLKIVKHDYTLLMPIKIPIVTNFMNKYLEKYLKRFSFIEYFIAVKV